MAAVAVVLIGLPCFLPLVGDYIELATQIVLGPLRARLRHPDRFTGLLSFGDAAFWGSYAAGMLLLRVSDNLLVGLDLGASLKPS